MIMRVKKILHFTLNFYVASEKAWRRRAKVFYCKNLDKHLHVSIEKEYDAQIFINFIHSEQWWLPISFHDQKQVR